MNSLISSNHPGAIHPILQIVLVQNSWRSKELNTICPPPQTEATTFAISSIFILLVLYVIRCQNKQGLMTRKQATVFGP